MAIGIDHLCGGFCIEGGRDDVCKPCWVEKGFVALHVDVPLSWALRGNFGNTVGASKAVVAGQHHVDVVGLTEVDDALIFGCNDYLLCGHYEQALLVATLNDCLASQLSECLARKARRCIAGRDDHDEVVVRGGHVRAGQTLRNVRC